MNLTQQAWPVSVLAWWMLWELHCLPFLHNFVLVLFLSVEVCTGQHLLLSVVLHRSPTAFALSPQIRLGSYEMPPMGHWPCLVSLTLCLPCRRTLVSHPGCGWPSSQGNKDWALALSFFLLSSALTLLPAKSLRMWISGVCICLFGHLS